MAIHIAKRINAFAIWLYDNSIIIGIPLSCFEKDAFWKNILSSCV